MLYTDVCVGPCSAIPIRTPENKPTPLFCMNTHTPISYAASSRGKCWSIATVKEVGVTTEDWLWQRFCRTVEKNACFFVLQATKAGA